MILSRAPQVADLNDAAQSILNELWAQWSEKQPRNIVRNIYLDAKNKLKDLEVSIPPQLADKLEVVSGWPEKAVFELSNRISLDAVTFGDSEDTYGIKDLLRQNRFSVEFPQAVVDSVSHSVSFASVTPGGPGEAPALIMFHSAMWATGIWDKRKRALSSGLVINDTDALGFPTRFTLLTDAWVATVAKTASSWVVTNRWDHSLGRTPMEMFPYRPSLGRPFGRARVDRTVMSITDRSIRAESRLEVQSELFSMMRLFLMGADESTFQDKEGKQIPLWSFYAGRLNTMSKDEEGDVPKLETITAESPEPHISAMRHFASRFSGHTGVPMSSLGISTDNPESANAKSMARDDIIQDVEKQHTVYGHSLERLLETAVMVQEGITERPEGFDELSLKWRRADRPTLASLADAGSKQVSAIAQIEGAGHTPSEVELELVGLDSSQIDRYLSARRRTQSRGLLDQILDRRQPSEDVEDEPVEVG